MVQLEVHNGRGAYQWGPLLCSGPVPRTVSYPTASVGVTKSVILTRTCMESIQTCIQAYTRVETQFKPSKVRVHATQ